MLYGQFNIAHTAAAYYDSMAILKELSLTSGMKRQKGLHYAAVWTVIRYLKITVQQHRSVILHIKSIYKSD